MIEIDYKIRFTTVHPDSLERGALSLGARLRYLIENALRTDGVVFKSPPSGEEPVFIDIARMEHIDDDEDSND